MDPSGHDWWEIGGGIIGGFAGAATGIIAGNIPGAIYGGIIGFTGGYGTVATIEYFLSVPGWLNELFIQKNYEIKHGIATSEADASEGRYNLNILNHDLPPLAKFAIHSQKLLYGNPTKYAQ